MSDYNSIKLTAEISLYPLNENFVPFIRAFINKLKSYDELTVASNNISTQISGNYDDVIRIIADEMKLTMLEQRSVLVVKYLMGDKLND